MNYWMPKNKKELTEALKYKEESTYLCAGATDLMIHLHSKKVASYSLIDLTHYNRLKTIEEKGDNLIIGALVTMSRLEADNRVKAYVPALAKAASLVGSVQIRNLATIGGNIGNASQSADTLPVLFAHDAVAVILNEKGRTKEKALTSLISEEGKTTLEEKEAIIYIKIKKDNVISAFDKVGSRKAVTISKVNGCIKVGLKDDGIIEKVSVYLGAVGTHALRAPLIEEVLIGKRLSDFEWEGPEEDKSKDVKSKDVKPKEEKPKEDESEEDKSKEDKSKEDESKENKSKEDESKEGNSKEIKLKEDILIVNKNTLLETIKEAVERQIETNIPDRPSKHYKKSAALGCILNMLEELQEKGGK